MINVYIIRGLPGSGKTTLAEKLAGEVGENVFEADQYFTRNGVYDYRHGEIEQAHRACRSRFNEKLISLVYNGGEGSIAVSNTFSTIEEFVPYINIVKSISRLNADSGKENIVIRHTIISLFDAGLSDFTLAKINKHKVPEYTIAKMRERWEHWEH